MFKPFSVSLKIQIKNFLTLKTFIKANFTLQNTKYHNNLRGEINFQLSKIRIFQ